MAGVKISALPAAVSAQLTDIIAAVQGGTTKQETLQQVLTLFQSSLSGSYLQIANNLSDVASQLTAYKNIFPTVNVTGTSQALVGNKKYHANNAGLVTFTLPATAAIGEEILIVGVGAGGWTVTCGTGQTLILGNKSSTTGIGGSLSSTNRRDCIRLSCVAADTDWQVTASIGNITYV